MSQPRAGSILRTLIEGIVLHPRRNRGTMPIEVYGEPSALFLIANGELPSAVNRMITVVAEERYRLYPTGQTSATASARSHKSARQAAGSNPGPAATYTERGSSALKRRGDRSKSG